MNERKSAKKKKASRVVKNRIIAGKLGKKIEERILFALDKSSEMVQSIREDRRIDPKKLHKPFDM